MSAPTPGVIARWTTRRPPRAGDRCNDCRIAVTRRVCAECGQLTGQSVGMLATVVETPFFNPARKTATPVR